MSNRATDRTVSTCTTCGAICRDDEPHICSEMYKKGYVIGRAMGEQFMDDTKPDAINPKHYQAHPSGVQCIDIIEHFPANIANVVKYCWRAGLKDGNSIIQDLEKAKWYIEREIGRQKKLNEVNEF